MINVNTKSSLHQNCSVKWSNTEQVLRSVGRIPRKSHQNLARRILAHSTEVCTSLRRCLAISYVHECSALIHVWDLEGQANRSNTALFLLSQFFYPFQLLHLSLFFYCLRSYDADTVVEASSIWACTLSAILHCKVALGIAQYCQVVHADISHRYRSWSARCGCFSTQDLVNARHMNRLPVKCFTRTRNHNHIQIVSCQLDCHINRTLQSVKRVSHS